MAVGTVGGNLKAAVILPAGEKAGLGAAGSVGTAVQFSLAVGFEPGGQHFGNGCRGVLRQFVFGNAGYCA